MRVPADATTTSGKLTGIGSEEEMETLITRPIERNVSTIEGIEGIESLPCVR